MKKLKQLIKRNPFFARFIWIIKHPIVKTKKISKEIEKVFLNLPFSLDNFNTLPKAQNLIVSLTSFPARIEYLEFTIFSLIKQTIRPEKIILWLSEKEFPGKENEIPENIKRYSSFGLEIQFVKENYKPYKKLIYTLKNYPNHAVLTADDDMFYKPKWLELFYNTHREFPATIIAHSTHRITFTDKKIDTYSKWKNNSKGTSYDNFGVGYGGILYPPRCLHEDIINPSLFLTLCPHNDDVWFYVMAILAKTKIRKTKNLFSRVCAFDYQLTEEYKTVPQLTDINWTDNMNNIQLEAALKYYNLYDTFFEFVTQG